MLGLATLNHFELGHTNARNRLRLVRRWAISSGSQRELVLALEYTADNLLEEKRPRAALKFLERAWSVVEAGFPGTDLACEILRRRALVLVELGDVAGACTAADEALRISSRIGDLYEQALAHRAVGVVCRELGMRDRAEDELSACLGILEGLGECFERAMTLEMLGRLHLDASLDAVGMREMDLAVAILARMGLDARAERIRELVALHASNELAGSIPVVHSTAEPALAPREHGIITVDPTIIAQFEQLARVARSDLPVIIQGESGTGKELFARALHTLSERSDKPFIPLNCGAIPPDMQESELFGHARGAFTGAVLDRSGFFEAADTGTLFLDEIGEMSPSAQVKLLRVLESGEFTRVGTTRVRQVDVRHVAATNVRLEEAVRQSRFRIDLYHRLNGLLIEIPPLRQRRADIPVLIQFFLEQLSSSARSPRIDRGLMDRLVAYDWPGNVRELRRRLQTAVVLSGGGSGLRTADFPFLNAVDPAARLNLDQGLDDVERGRLLEAMERSRWSKSGAARILGISRTTLTSKLIRLGIPLEPPDRFRSPRS